MGTFKTNARKKLRKALKRVHKVVIMDIRRQLDQQRKRKAEEDFANKHASTAFTTNTPCASGTIGPQYHYLRPRQ